MKTVMDGTHVATKEAPIRARDLIGTYHRIAGIGPSYEVVGIVDERYASILLLETGETVSYRIEDIRIDPHPDDTCTPWPST